MGLLAELFPSKDYGFPLLLFLAFIFKLCMVWLPLIFFSTFLLRLYHSIWLNFITFYTFISIFFSNCYHMISYSSLISVLDLIVSYHLICISFYLDFIAMFVRPYVSGLQNSFVGCFMLLSSVITMVRLFGILYI